MKYRSEIDILKLIKAAKAELRDSLPEAYKVFLLAVGAGLRKKKTDLLEWPSFRGEQNVIRIESTRYFHPQTKNPIADLSVDRHSRPLFHTYHPHATQPSHIDPTLA